MKIASERKHPIPVYAEMSSINSVMVFPVALASRAEDIAASLALGAGQFRTNPGLILAVDGKGLETVIARAREMLPETSAQTMLTPSIAKAFGEGVGRLERHAEVCMLAKGKTGGAYDGVVALFQTSAASLLAHHELQEGRGGACRTLQGFRQAGTGVGALRRPAHRRASR